MDKNIIDIINTKYKIKENITTFESDSFSDSVQNFLQDAIHEKAADILDNSIENTKD